MQNNLTMKRDSSAEIDFDQMADMIFSSVEDATHNEVEQVTTSVQEMDDEEKEKLVEEVEGVEEPETNDQPQETEEVEAIGEEEEEDEESETDTAEEVTETEDEKSNAYSVLKFLLDSGELEDLEVFVDDSEEGKLLSEYKDIDEDTLKTIIEEKRKKDAKEDSEKKLDLKGVDENQKRLINIIKNSSFEEAKQIFQNELPLKEPWSDYDPTNEEHQAIAYRYYLTTALGQTPSEANDMVEVAKKNLVLDKKANAVVEKQREIYKDSLARKEKEVEENRKRQLEEDKKFKTTLGEMYKDLPLEKTKEFVKSATTKTETGTTVVEDKFREVMQDPEKASKLIMYLLDEELFLKDVTSKARTEEQIENIKRIRIASSSKKTRGTQNRKESDDSPEDIDETLKSIFNLK